MATCDRRLRLFQAKQSLAPEVTEGGIEDPLLLRLVAYHSGEIVGGRSSIVVRRAVGHSHFGRQLELGLYKRYNTPLPGETRRVSRSPAE